MNYPEIETNVYCKNENGAISPILSSSFYIREHINEPPLDHFINITSHTAEISTTNINMKNIKQKMHIINNII